MKILIKEVDQKQGKSGNTYLLVVDAAGNKYSCWDMQLSSILKPGSNVEVETKKEGNFTNIISAKQVQTQESMTKEDWAEKDNQKRRSIERQISAELAVSLVNSGKVEPAVLLKWADRIYAWISVGLVEAAKGLGAVEV